MQIALDMIKSTAIGYARRIRLNLGSAEGAYWMLFYYVLLWSSAMLFHYAIQLCCSTMPFNYVVLQCGSTCRWNGSRKIDWRERKVLVLLHSRLIGNRQLEAGGSAQSHAHSNNSPRLSLDDRRATQMPLNPTRFQWYAGKIIWGVIVWEVRSFGVQSFEVQSIEERSLEKSWDYLP